MVKFDDDGWFIGQKINTKVNHGEEYEELYEVKINKDLIFPEYDKSKYVVYGHTASKECVENFSCYAVPLYQTNYKGKKFAKWNKKGSGALALIGRSKIFYKEVIIKILIPKF